MSVPGPRDGVLREAPSRGRADEWALALASQGLHPKVLRGNGRGFLLAVPEPERERAEAVLEAYEAENAPVREARSPAPRDPDALRNASLASASLLAFFLVTGPRSPDVSWFARGGADASRILDGELWRAVTALTLHADGPHVAGNALLGAVFGSAVCRTLGPGVALAWVVAAGALGNLANAWLRTAAHVSVGASTAVFGALGILGGLGLTRRLRLGVRGRRAWIPVAATLGLLAMLGTGGERVDLWAHAFGLLAGVALGVAAPRSPSRGLQWGAGLAALAGVLGSWALALA